MSGKDLFLGLNYVKAKFIDEAETVTALKEGRRGGSIRKAILIAAVVALLAVTVTACAYAIQRIRMNLVQHYVPVQTDVVAEVVENTSESQSVNFLTDCYPQDIPEGYEILCGSPLNYTSRSIEYHNKNGNSIIFSISTVQMEDDLVLRPPVEESTVTIAGNEGTLKSNEGAQVLQWYNGADGYEVSLFTDDLTVDLVHMAESVGYGASIPVSVWYHCGQEWNSWYPLALPDGYDFVEVSPVSDGYQTFKFTNGENEIRYGISTTRELLPPSEISDEAYYVEVEVNGIAAKMLCNQSTQRTLFWENKEEGFDAFLETMDETIDLIAVAESVGPGPKMEVSKFYLGPDYTIELEQEPAVYIEWQSVYPQNIPDGYVLKTVGDRAYGQQTMEWKNEAGDLISYTLYFRLGQYGREFEGVGEPEVVSINGHTGYRTGNSLLWTDEELGFAYDLRVTGDVDLIALAESVGPGPELAPTNDRTDVALEQLGDYRITELPENMVEDGLSGAPLEGEDDWYSYVRRWYYDRTNNDQIYFTYETYLTDCTTEEEVLRLFVNGMAEPDFVTINGYHGITMQDGDRAYVAWMKGDVSKGVSFQLFSEQFTVDELLHFAQSVKKP